MAQWIIISIKCYGYGDGDHSIEINLDHAEASCGVLKAVDTIGNYSLIFISIKPHLVTSNGERMII